MTHTDIDRLEAEIRAQRNSLLNAIANRRDHPTYGYTKAGINNRLRILEGMLTAWFYVTGIWDQPATLIWDSATLATAKTKLDVDLANLNGLVRVA